MELDSLWKRVQCFRSSQKSHTNLNNLSIDLAPLETNKGFAQRNCAVPVFIVYGHAHVANGATVN